MSEVMSPLVVANLTVSAPIEICPFSRFLGTKIVMSFISLQLNFVIRKACILNLEVDTHVQINTYRVIFVILR